MQKILAHKWLLFSLLIAIFAGRMLLTDHHFYVHDDIQVFRVNEFINCFKEGQIPCRWSNNLGKGYGMPWFNFYPPMIYLIPAMIHQTGLSIIASLNLLMFLSFILAAWGMYCLVKALTMREDVAYLGSILFTLYPFHATNVFLRGVYAENLAWSLAPWILYYLYRQAKSGIFEKVLPWLFALIFLTHVISSFLIIGSALVFVSLINFKSIKLVLGQIFLAICFSAFFLIPALVEKNLVQSTSLIEGYYSYLNHFVTLKQLFINYTWNYGSSYWDTPSVEMGYMVGHIHLILLSVLSLITIIYYRHSEKLKLIIAMIGIFIFTIFLTHNQSAPIWRMVSNLSYIQFPWRFIGWAGIPLVLSLSLMLSLLTSRSRQIIIILTTIALLFYSYPFFFPREYDGYQDADFISGQFKLEQQSKALFDYLPLTVPQIPTEPYGIFYFPGWTSSIKLEVDNQTGLIVNPPRDLAWHETPFRLAMDLVSLSSLLAYLMYNKAYGKKG